MDEGEETGAQTSAYEKRNLKGYKGTQLPSHGIKVFILNSYFDSLDEYNFTDKEEYQVTKFVVQINKNGFVNLEGRNKQSNDPDSDKPCYLEKVTFANEHKLFHYHIGVGHYAGPFGDKTSEFVVHYSYCQLEKAASIISVAPHPPFNLPTTEELESGINTIHE